MKVGYESVVPKIKSEWELLDVFMRRMKAMGIELKLGGNAPWIYIDYINGQRVTEKFKAEHGFTIGFYPRNKEEGFTFTDTKEIFKLIKKYTK